MDTREYLKRSEYILLGSGFFLLLANIIIASGGDLLLWYASKALFAIGLIAYLFGR